MSDIDKPSWWRSATPPLNRPTSGAKSRGRITLPDHLSWSGPTSTFDLDDPAEFCVVYATVLREGSQGRCPHLDTSADAAGTRCGCRRPSTRRGTDGFENTAFMSLSELQQRIASLVFSLAEAEGFALARGGDSQKTPSCGAAMSRDAASTQPVATISASSDSSVVTGS